MTDCISRDAVLAAACEGCNAEFGDMPCEPSDCYIMQSLRTVPALDAETVVRCGECRHKGWIQEPEHGKSVDYCRLIERCVDEKFFCACGEKE